jgi:hypothetical protein
LGLLLPHEQKGLQKAANLLASAMTQLQIKRISEESGLPVFSFFQAEEPATAWLRSE